MFGVICADVPGRPGVPEVCDITDTSMRLLWGAPASDGGAPITSYTVEYMKRGDTKWVPLETGKPDLTYTVQGLQTSSNYLFRVSASNKVLKSYQPHIYTLLILQMNYKNLK